jgi:hypothetical protein
MKAGADCGGLIFIFSGFGFAKIAVVVSVMIANSKILADDLFLFAILLNLEIDTLTFRLSPSLRRIF